MATPASVLGSVAGGASGAALAELLQELRDRAERIEEVTVHQAEIWDAFIRHIKDEGQLLRSNAYDVLSVGTNSTEQFQARQKFADRPALGFVCLAAPATGLNIRINAGPQIPDVQETDSLDNFNIHELEAENTDGTTAATLLIHGRVHRLPR